MGLQFIGEVGVYFPDRDAVKITALDGDRVVDCYTCRRALEGRGRARGLPRTRMRDSSPRVCQDHERRRATVWALGNLEKGRGARRQEGKGRG